MQFEARLLRIIAFLIVLITIFACNRDSGTESRDDGPPPVIVRVQKVAKGDVKRILRYTGDIEAQVDIRIFSQIPDRIIRLNVKEYSWSLGIANAVAGLDDLPIWLKEKVYLVHCRMQYPNPLVDHVLLRGYIRPLRVVGFG